MTLKLHPKAEDDLNYALDHYNNIDQTFENIIKFPNLYPFETEFFQIVCNGHFPFYRTL